LRQAIINNTMANYLAIFGKEEKCSPVSLQEGILHVELNKKAPFDPIESDSDDWREKRNIKIDLPKELWFVTRDKCYSFDLRFDSGGFFVSDGFLSLLNEFGIKNYVAARLNMLNRKLEVLPDKSYHYIKFFGFTDVIDYEKSKIDFDKKGVVKKVWELCLKEEGLSDVFMIDSWIFYNRLFCSEAFKEAAIKKGVAYGIQFFSVKEAGIVNEWQLVSP
jgi:hypothetical protein